MCFQPGDRNVIMFMWLWNLRLRKDSFPALVTGPPNTQTRVPGKMLPWLASKTSIHSSINLPPLPVRISSPCVMTWVTLITNNVHDTHDTNNTWHKRSLTHSSSWKCHALCLVNLHLLLAADSRNLVQIFTRKETCFQQNHFLVLSGVKDTYFLLLDELKSLFDYYGNISLIKSL